MPTYYVDSSATGKGVTGATNANPCVVTCVAHGFTNGDKVAFWNVGGMTQLNWSTTNLYTVANKTDDTFELSGIDSSAYGAYTSGGTAHNGKNWTDAWKTLHVAVYNAPTGGDIIYCRNSETISAKITLASSGTNPNGPISVIGCNASGNVDGTRYIIDGGGGGRNILDLAGYDFWFFQNIQFQNTGAGTYYGVYSSVSNADGHCFLNCCFTSCGADGIRLSTLIRFGRLICCVSHDNTGYGFWGGTNAIYLFCSAYGNDDSGWNLSNDYMVHIGCISHDNLDDGYEGLKGSNVMINCVADKNDSDGLLFTAHSDVLRPVIIGCRITNNTDGGIDCGASTEPILLGWNYLQNTDDLQNDTYLGVINVDSLASGKAGFGTTDSNKYSPASVTDYNYVSSTGDNFATSTDTDDPLRRVPIVIPWT